MRQTRWNSLTKPIYSTLVWNFRLLLRQTLAHGTLMQNLEATATAFSLAHLSDPHLTRPVAQHHFDLFNKRFLGYQSWRRRRRHEHRPEILDALLDDLHANHPDHTAITGDMTHIGLASEFRQVADWLSRVGSPADVTVVPGNHDTYVHHPWDGGLGLWSDYMGSDRAENAPHDIEGFFPTLRIRGPVALIGLSSARPSAPLLAVGSLGKRQLDRLEAILTRTAALGLCRILLIHHPPKPGTVGWRKRLTDAPALTRLLANQGIELVLHGHSHLNHLGWVNTPAGKAPAVGVRSASALGLRPGRRAQYHLYRISLTRQQRSLAALVREYVPEQGTFATVHQWSAELPTP